MSDPWYREPGHLSEEWLAGFEDAKHDIDWTNIRAYGVWATQDWMGVKDYINGWLTGYAEMDSAT